MASVSVAGAAAGRTPADASFAGRSLEEALLALRERGVMLVFNSRVVSPDLRVTKEPVGSEPSEILAELLAPHGLTTREGPAGVLIVVRAPSPAPPSRGRVAGRIRDRDSGRPLAGMELRLTESRPGLVVSEGGFRVGRPTTGGRSTVSGDDGRFRFDDVEPGRYRLHSSGPGFLPWEGEVRVFGTNGTAASGTAASGTAASGTAASGTAASGTAASGTAASRTAASGTAASGTASEEAATRTAANRVAATALDLELTPLPETYEVIDVNVRHGRLLGDRISSLTVGNERLVSMPQIGEDVLRPLKLLPGATGTDLSAELNIRGGRQDEVLLRLDGLEILEPYHLRDFNNALSILAPAAIGGAELLTGGFRSEFGDRMGGVLDLTSVDPGSVRRLELGLSTLWFQAHGSGTWNRGRRSWLASLRGGSLDLVAKAAREEKDPRFGDLFAKLEQQVGDRQVWRFDALFSNDRLDFETAEHDFERFRSRYSNVYGWLTHQAVLGRSWLVESMASYSHFEKNRRGSEQNDLGQLTLSDVRRLDVVGLRQSWAYSGDGRSELRWGFDARSLNVHYNYTNQRSFQANPLAAILDRPGGILAFHQGFRGDQYAAYVSDRWQLEDLSFEAGLRFDENTIVDDERFSPRLTVAYELSERTRLRLAWGHFYQSQRVYELQVEDGEDRFHRGERAEHRVLGLERTWPRRGTAGRGPWILRAEVYERRISYPVVRFENLFEPISVAPELEADRLRLEPDSGLSRGIEIFVSGDAGRRINWFASYTRSQVVDRIANLDGSRDVPRNIDQPDNFQIDVDFRSPWGWDLNLAADYHTGWPTTDLSARVEDGEIVPVLGSLYGRRLSDYTRLDLRVARRWPSHGGDLEFFLNVHNLADRNNPRGFDISFGEVSGDEVEVIRRKKHWGGIFPSLGIRWTW